jgi:hypothetical protein
MLHLSLLLGYVGTVNTMNKIQTSKDTTGRANDLIRDHLRCDSHGNDLPLTQYLPVLTECTGEYPGAGQSTIFESAAPSQSFAAIASDQVPSLVLTLCLQ